eukprot:g2335.t1
MKEIWDAYLIGPHGSMPRIVRCDEIPIATFVAGRKCIAPSGSPTFVLELIAGARRLCLEPFADSVSAARGLEIFFPLLLSLLPSATRFLSEPSNEACETPSHHATAAVAACSTVVGCVVDLLRHEPHRIGRFVSATLPGLAHLLGRYVEECVECDGAGIKVSECVLQLLVALTDVEHRECNVDVFSSAIECLVTRFQMWHLIDDATVSQMIRHLLRVSGASVRQNRHEKVAVIEVLTRHEIAHWVVALFNREHASSAMLRWNGSLSQKGASHAPFTPRCRGRDLALTAVELLGRLLDTRDTPRELLRHIGVLAGSALHSLESCTSILAEKKSMSSSSCTRDRISGYRSWSTAIIKLVVGNLSGIRGHNIDLLRECSRVFDSRWFAAVARLDRAICTVANYTSGATTATIALLSMLVQKEAFSKKAPLCTCLRALRKHGVPANSKVGLASAFFFCQTFVALAALTLGVDIQSAMIVLEGACRSMKSASLRDAIRAFDGAFVSVLTAMPRPHREGKCRGLALFELLTFLRTCIVEAARVGEQSVLLLLSFYIGACKSLRKGLRMHKMTTEMFSSVGYGSEDSWTGVSLPVQLSSAVARLTATVVLICTKFPLPKSLSDEIVRDVVGISTDFVEMMIRSQTLSDVSKTNLATTALDDCTVTDAEDPETTSRMVCTTASQHTVIAALMDSVENHFAGPSDQHLRALLLSVLMCHASRGWLALDHSRQIVADGASVNVAVPVDIGESNESAVDVDESTSSHAQPSLLVQMMKRASQLVLHDRATKSKSVAPTCRMDAFNSAFRGLVLHAITGSDEAASRHALRFVATPESMELLFAENISKMSEIPASILSASFLGDVMRYGSTGRRRRSVSNSSAGSLKRERTLTAGYENRARADGNDDDNGGRGFGGGDEDGDDGCGGGGDKNDSSEVSDDELMGGFAHSNGGPISVNAFAEHLAVHLLSLLRPRKAHSDDDESSSSKKDGISRSDDAVFETCSASKAIAWLLVWSRSPLKELFGEKHLHGGLDLLLKVRPKIEKGEMTQKTNATAATAGAYATAAHLGAFRKWYQENEASVSASIARRNAGLLLPWPAALPGPLSRLRSTRHDGKSATENIRKMRVAERNDASEGSRRVAESEKLDDGETTVRCHRKLCRSLRIHSQSAEWAARQRVYRFLKHARRSPNTLWSQGSECEFSRRLWRLGDVEVPSTRHAGDARVGLGLRRVLLPAKEAEIASDVEHIRASTKRERPIVDVIAMSAEYFKSLLPHCRGLKDEDTTVDLENDSTASLMEMGAKVYETCTSSRPKNRSEGSLKRWARRASVAVSQLIRSGELLARDFACTAESTTRYEMSAALPPSPPSHQFGCDFVADGNARPATLLIFDHAILVLSAFVPSAPATSTGEAGGRDGTSRDDAKAVRTSRRVDWKALLRFGVSRSQDVSEDDGDATSAHENRRVIEISPAYAHAFVPAASLRDARPCRYLLRRVGIEIECEPSCCNASSCASILVTFPSKTIRDEAHEIILRCLQYGRRSLPRHERRFDYSTAKGRDHVLSAATRSWQRGHTSNTTYLLILNKLAGRTYRDFGQYPVFPWIISDYEAPLDTLLSIADAMPKIATTATVVAAQGGGGSAGSTSASAPTVTVSSSSTGPDSTAQGDAQRFDDSRDARCVFRDLSKPMGALREERRKLVIARYQSLVREGGLGGSAAFHYGTHYSCPAYVANFLVRVYPFASVIQNLQSGKGRSIFEETRASKKKTRKKRHFEKSPDRLFWSLSDAWASASGGSAETGFNTHDVRELVPEMYCSPSCLSNVNAFNFGRRQSGDLVDAVQLPKWARSDAGRFVAYHRRFLDSVAVSAVLPRWIDLVFGHLQQGYPSINATNVFHPYSYAEVYDKAVADYRRANADDASNEDTRILLSAAAIHVREYGQTPQLGWIEHPHGISSSTTALALSSCGQRLVTGSADGRLGFWSVHMTECETESGTSDDVYHSRRPRLYAGRAGHRCRVRAIAIAAVYDMVVSGGADGSVHQWTLFGGDFLRSIDTCPAVATPKMRDLLDVALNQRSGELFAMYAGKGPEATDATSSDDHRLALWSANGVYVASSESGAMDSKPVCVEASDRDYWMEGDRRPIKYFDVSGDDSVAEFKLRVHEAMRTFEEPRIRDGAGHPDRWRLVPRCSDGWRDNEQDPGQHVDAMDDNTVQNSTHRRKLLRNYGIDASTDEKCRAIRVDYILKHGNKLGLAGGAWGSVRCGAGWFPFLGSLQSPKWHGSAQSIDHHSCGVSIFPVSKGLRGKQLNGFSVQALGLTAKHCVRDSANVDRIFDQGNSATWVSLGTHQVEGAHYHFTVLGYVAALGSYATGNDVAVLFLGKMGPDASDATYDRLVRDVGPSVGRPFATKVRADPASPTSRGLSTSTTVDRKPCPKTFDRKLCESVAGCVLKRRGGLLARAFRSKSKTTVCKRGKQKPPISKDDALGIAPHSAVSKTTYQFPPELLGPKASLTTAGWGLATHHNKPSHIDRARSRNIAMHLQCIYHLKQTKSMGLEKKVGSVGVVAPAGQGINRGDSGAPLVYTGLSNVVVGVLSTGEISVTSNVMGHRANYMNLMNPSNSALQTLCHAFKATIAEMATPIFSKTAIMNTLTTATTHSTTTAVWKFVNTEAPTNPPRPLPSIGITAHFAVGGIIIAAAVLPPAGHTAPRTPASGTAAMNEENSGRAL